MSEAHGTSASTLTSLSAAEPNFTGQRKDDSGLLFYNARNYDPKLSRFISADSIVPGMALGKGAAGVASVALKPSSVFGGR